MDRRKFLKNTTITGLALPALSVSACNTTQTDLEINESTTDDFELNEVMVEELQEGMENGKYTSRSITEMYLKRIEEIEKDPL